MSNKKNSPKSDDPWLVFSTLKNSDSSLQDDTDEVNSVPANQQRLRMQIEKNHRGGKTVVVIKGFIGPEAQLQELAKQLKQHCGVGGSTKDGEIIIQGDQKDKLIKKLNSLGYKDVK